jgi:16S rRNA (adenine1518-N6/adenine1519-N6)-dimethyltransferase
MIQTKKSLGQHFLRSERALADMVNAVPLSTKDVILEIGPGEGVLTEKLLATGAHIIAVEKDNRLIPVLRERFADAIKSNRLTLLHGDAVEEEMLAMLRTLLPVGWVLVANIPYYITGLILRTFLDGTQKPSRMVLLVQREVAEDIVARDGKESIGSIAVKVYGNPSIVARVPRGAFVPPPTVDSAVLRIEHIGEAFINEKEREHFFFLLRAGFKSRRKTILNTLSAGTGLPKEEVGKRLLALHITPETRPERLSLYNWKKIAGSF